MVNASELKLGVAVRIDGQIFKALGAEFKAGAGQAGGVVKTKLRNVTTGRFWEPHFRPEERLEELELSRQTMELCALRSKPADISSGCASNASVALRRA